MARKLDPKVAEGVMLAANLEPLEPYSNALAKWKCQCKICGSVVYPKYNTIYSGKGGCRTCGNKAKHERYKLSQVEVDARLKEKGLVALEEYFNSETSLRCKCLKCGHLQSIKFSYINKVHGCSAQWHWIGYFHDFRKIPFFTLSQNFICTNCLPRSYKRVSIRPYG